MPQALMYDLLHILNAQVFIGRDHPYITSAYFWTFSDPPTHYARINTVLNMSQNDQFSIINVNKHNNNYKSQDRLNF